MLIQRLWATPGVLHQVLCREVLPESPKPSKLAWPSEAAPKRHLHRVHQALQKAWHSFVVQRALCLFMASKAFVQRALCLFMASSCAIATRCNLPNKLSMLRSLHPLPLAVVRDKLGMPVAQLIVLLKVGFQLHGHSTNDGLAVIGTRKLLQVMRRLQGEGLHTFEVQFETWQQFADVLVELLRVLALHRALKHALQGNHRIADDLLNLPGVTGQCLYRLLQLLLSLRLLLILL